jgi:uncharacterized protein YdaU (DUF1376 family)
MAPEKLLAEWFWIDRWMGSRAFGLPIEARGLYREMLSQAWRRGAQLPNDPQQIKRITGVTSGEWRRAWPQIEQFWRVDGEYLVNDTQVEIYCEAKGRSEKASQRGLRGAQARFEQHASTAQALLKQSPSTAQVVLEHKPPSPISDLRSPEEHKSVRVFPKMSEKPSDEIGTRAAKFIDRYGELYPLHRNGARFMPKPALDYQTACELVSVWPDDRLEKLAIIFLKTDHEFAASGSRTLRQFAALAGWCDGRLAEVEKAKSA